MSFTLPRGSLGKRTTRAHSSLMAVYSETFELKTQGKGTYEVTERVAEVVKKSGISEGVATVFIRHTSASLIIYENADRSARVDLHAFFDRLVPEDQSYFTHVFEGADDMPSHLRMVLTRTSETIPVVRKRMTLGTWQGIFLFEHRRQPHHREIAVAVIGE